jgi:hypothetical protein
MLIADKHITLNDFQDHSPTRGLIMVVVLQAPAFDPKTGYMGHSLHPGLYQTSAMPART